MNKIIIVLPATIIFVYFDIALSILSFGFYHSTFNFDSNLITKYLFLKDGGYSFLSSPLDFLLLSIFRSIILIIGVLYFLKKGTPKWNLFFVGILLLNISFTFTKILAFAEIYEQLKFPGVWFSIAWNFAAFILLFPIWFGIYRSKNLQIHASSLWNNAGTQPEDCDQLIVEDNDGDAEVLAAVYPKVVRISTMKHIAALFSFCKYHGKWFISGFIFLLTYSLARVFQPYFTGQVVANILYVKTMSDLMKSILIMSALGLVSALTGGLRGGCFSYATALVNKKMRSDLFKNLIKQEIAFFDENKTGEIISRLTSDCQTMSSMISTNINVFLRNLVMMIGSLIFMVTISWRLTFVAFITAPLIGFVTKVYGVYYDRLSEATQTTIAQANAIAEQAIGTIRTVRSFACEIKELDRFENKLIDTLNVNKKKSIAYMGYTCINELSTNIILITTLFYGGHLVINKQMTPDALFSFLLYQMQLGENISAIGSVFTGLMESVGASRKVFEYMRREPKINNNGLAKPLKIDGEIEFKDVTFAYPTRPTTTVLDDVTFNVNPNETIALVGPSGAGKSSIISLLEHFYESQNGDITLDGISIKDYDHKYFHQKVALVAQEPVLYDGSVRYNILYGCEEWKTENDMIEAAKLANIHDFIMETEKGYDTQCGEKGVQMSGGQKQRIAIARALVRSPAVLILDEATSALDAESEHIIQEALQKCAIGRTVIVIAHRLSTVEKADRIVVIQKGKIVQFGNHQSLMQDPTGLYFSLVHRQLQNVD